MHRKRGGWTAAFFLVLTLGAAVDAKAGWFSWMRSSRHDDDCCQPQQQCCRSCEKREKKKDRCCCCFPKAPPESRVVMAFPFEVSNELPEEGEETSGQVDQLGADMRSLEVDVTKLALEVKK